MKSKYFISLVVSAVFIALRFTKHFYAYLIFGKEKWNLLNEDLRIALINYSQIIIVLLTTYLIFRKNPLPILGLKNGIKNAFFVALISSLPMFIGLGIMTGFNLHFSLLQTHRDLMMAGFFEEFVFRGFMFGLLFYYGGLGFITSVLIPSVFFGLSHLYQADSFVDGLSIFLFTLLASAGFAWFYLAWKSLWMVIFLHGFMDLIWEAYDVQTNVTGNLIVNIFRFATLGIAIYLSIRKAKQLGTYNLRGKLWLNTQ